MSLRATSISQQLSILRSRGMILPENAGEVLTQYGYYNLINGYKDPFLDRAASRTAGNDMYLPGTNLQHLVALYQFDFNLRTNLFRGISFIETQVKSMISLQFSTKYGAGMEAYLSENSYRAGSRHTEALIKKLEGDIHYFSHIKPHQAICHSLRKYNDIPIWILNTVISFGTMSKMYDALTDDVKKRIAREICSGLKPGELSSMLYFLTDIRNKCAHNNRLYSHRLDQRSMRVHRIRQMRIHKALGIPLGTSGIYECGQDDILAVFISFAVFFHRNHVQQVDYDVFNQHLALLEEQISPDVLSYIRNITGLHEVYMERLSKIS